MACKESEQRAWTCSQQEQRPAEFLCCRVPHLHGGIYQPSAMRPASTKLPFRALCSCSDPIEGGPNDKKVARDRTLQDPSKVARAPKSQRWDFKTQPTRRRSKAFMNALSTPFREDFKSPNNKPFISAHSFVVSDSAHILLHDSVRH